MNKMTLIVLLTVFSYQLKAQYDPPKANYWIDLGISGYGKFDSYLGVTLAYNRAVYKDLFMGAGYSLAVNFEPVSSTFFEDILPCEPIPTPAVRSDLLTPGVKRGEWNLIHFVHRNNAKEKRTNARLAI